MLVIEYLGGWKQRRKIQEITSGKEEFINLTKKRE